MKNFSIKSLYPYILLILLFIFQALLYNDDACSLSSQVCFQDFTFVELIHKPDIPQTPDDSLFNNLDDYPSICGLDNLYNSKFKFLQ